jgi:hypothetical protein
MLNLSNDRRLLYCSKIRCLNHKTNDSVKKGYSKTKNNCRKQKYTEKYKKHFKKQGKKKNTSKNVLKKSHPEHALTIESPIDDRTKKTLRFNEGLKRNYANAS